jgi:hypothetical protein
MAFTRSATQRVAQALNYWGYHARLHDAETVIVDLNEGDTVNSYRVRVTPLYSPSRLAAKKAELHPIERYDLCASDCTTDCGHCKGKGKPHD